MREGKLLFKEPMYNAHCSYKSCDNHAYYPRAMPGSKCPKCGKPLSWNGAKCIRMPFGKVTNG